MAEIPIVIIDRDRFRRFQKLPHLSSSAVVDGVRCGKYPESANTSNH